MSLHEAVLPSGTGGGQGEESLVSLANLCSAGAICWEWGGLGISRQALDLGLSPVLDF